MGASETAMLVNGNAKDKIRLSGRDHEYPVTRTTWCMQQQQTLSPLSLKKGQACESTSEFILHH